MPHCKNCPRVVWPNWKWPPNSPDLNRNKQMWDVLAWKNLRIYCWYLGADTTGPLQWSGGVHTSELFWQGRPIRYQAGGFDVMADWCLSPKPFNPFITGQLLTTALLLTADIWMNLWIWYLLVQIFLAHFWVLYTALLGWEWSTIHSYAAKRRSQIKLTDETVHQQIQRWKGGLSNEVVSESVCKYSNCSSVVYAQLLGVQCLMQRSRSVRTWLGTSQWRAFVGICNVCVVRARRTACRGLRLVEIDLKLFHLHLSRTDKKQSWSVTLMLFSGVYGCTFFFQQNGTADAATMYPDEIYTAGVCYGLDVAVGESYNGVGKYSPVIYTDMRYPLQLEEMNRTVSKRQKNHSFLKSKMLSVCTSWKMLRVRMILQFGLVSKFGLVLHILSVWANFKIFSK